MSRHRDLPHLRVLRASFRASLSMLSCLFLIPPGGKAAQSAQEKETEPRVLAVQYVESGPDVDGNPHDGIWKRALPDSSFHILGTSHTSSSLTTVRALYDRMHLYLLIECRGKPTRNIVATTVARDGRIWEKDDEVEFFLFPPREEPAYVQLVTNVVGAKADLRVTFSGNVLKKRMDADYVWEARPSWQEDSWTVEMRIPMRQFAGTVKAGETWKANFSRYLRLPDSRVLLTWSPADSSFHEPERFGFLRFEREVSFDAFGGIVDWEEDEKAALVNMDRLYGSPRYTILRDYLDEITIRMHRNRSFRHLCDETLSFAVLYPDSLDATDAAIRVVTYAARRTRAAPEEASSFGAQIQEILTLDQFERDLFHLASTLSQYWLHQPDDRETAWEMLGKKDNRLAATTAFLVLMNATEETSSLQDALSMFTELVIEGKEPLYIDPATLSPSAVPAENELNSLVYPALQRALHLLPREVMELASSITTDPQAPADLKAVMLKLTFELVSDPHGQFFSRPASESLLVALFPVDAKHAAESLHRYLTRRMQEWERVDLKEAGDSIPEDVRRTVALRKHLKGGHRIDRMLSRYYESADSLEKAVHYMESYVGALEAQSQVRADAERQLRELRFRRDSTRDPGFYVVPRDSFRLVYKRADESSTTFIDLSAKGKAIYYNGMPREFDPRVDVAPTIPTEVDSPAVVFHVPAQDIDSLHSILARRSFLGFAPEYSFHCEECGLIEITLFTPRNARTVRFLGNDPANVFSQAEIVITSRLAKYMRLGSAHSHDWKELTRSFRLLDESIRTDRTPNERLDSLLELFTGERTENVLELKEWYVTPLLDLAGQAGRLPEVHSVVGLEYFDRAFRWRRFAWAHVPLEADEYILGARYHLKEAIPGAEDPKEREWYEFLYLFSEQYAGPLEGMIQEAESLAQEENLANARSLLLWLACAKDDFARAANLHEELLRSDAPDRVKTHATIRMIMYSTQKKKYGDALTYIDVLEKDFLGILPGNRKSVYLEEIDHYSRIDLLLDKSELLCKVGEIPSALELLAGIEEKAIPPDRRDRFRRVLRLEQATKIPDVYMEAKAREYSEIIEALRLFESYEKAAEWAFWMKEHSGDPDVRLQVLATMLDIISARKEWDELSRNLADAVFEISWEQESRLHGRFLDILLSPAIRYGGREEVIRIWNDHLASRELSPMYLIATVMILDYLRSNEEVRISREILEKILREIPGLEEKVASILLSDRREDALEELQLISSKYALELASVYMSEPGKREEAITMVDSLSRAMPCVSPAAYPLIFMALCAWKADHLEWEALSDFLGPYADSLIEAEMRMPRGVYSPPEPCESRLDSPLLALKCILMEEWGRKTDGFDLITLFPAETGEAGPDDVLRRFDVDFDSFNMSCGQAHLFTWSKPGPFRNILDSFTRKFRQP